MGKQKLKITRYATQKDLDGLANGGNEFKTFVNPSEITVTQGIEYDHNETIYYAVAKKGDEKTPDDGGGAPTRFKKYKSSTLKLKLTFDNTGIIEGGDVLPAIEKLKSVVYYYNHDGKQKDAPYVRIAWGNMSFHGVLQDIVVNFKLFNSDGEPIRATVDLTFKSTIAKETLIKKMKKSSSEQSKVMVVKDRDTLPMMCEEVYGDSSLYLEVANANGMVNFRDLEPGQEIIFPPKFNR